ncbi:LysR family transcriptional regulator [Phormidium tenue FACHB-886]|nr:LysR family transcriptional regulator [Phormidium tenue FACHB-886]
MSIEGIKLHQLRSLVAVAKSGNFSEAALVLAVSQSAVSHAIAALEEELGVVLFSRGRHGATLTSVGDRVVSHAQDILRSLDNISSEAKLAKGLKGGQVRIAAFRSAATHLLPKAIAQFQRRFPAIEVILRDLEDCDQIESALRKGQIDLGITILPTSDDFEVWEVLRDDYVALLPPDVTFKNNPLTWEQLAAYPLILPTGNFSCRMIVSDYAARVGRSLTPTYEFRDDSTILSMVEQGLGITIIARLAAQPISPQIHVRQLPQPLERIIGIAMLKSALHPPSVYAFLENLKTIERSAEVELV